MILSSALDPAQFDFVWVPEEPAGQENISNANNGMPVVKCGPGKSPTWEGQGAARTEFPSDASAGRHMSPERDYSRAYPDRCRSSPVQLLHDFGNTVGDPGL